MKNIKYIIYSAFTFFFVTMPFREFFKVMEVTEMRPASTLPPVLGLMFGVPGALGCAIGNLAADILSGYNPLLCILSFAAQFFYGIFPLFLWKLFNRFHMERDMIFKLNKTRNVIRYISFIFADSVLMSIILGLLMRFFNISTFFSITTLMLFLNNFVFCLTLGIPIIIFISAFRSRNHSNGISLNERLILIFLLLGAVSAILIGVFAFAEFSHDLMTPLAMWNKIYLYISLDLLVFYFIIVVCLIYFEKNITIPLETITDTADNYISSKEYKKDSAYVTSQCEALCKIQNETGVLARAFQTMAIDLDVYIDNLAAVMSEKERINAELSIAAKIQTSMLPRIFPKIKNFDIFASMRPAKEVGGDFYDFFLIDNDNLAVVIADVSGKGIPAALFMAIAKTVIKNNAQSGKSPKETFEAVNNILHENNDTDMFVTAFMGFFQISTGKFTFVNSGHNPPIICRNGELCNFIPVKPGFILAGMENIAYHQEEIELKDGDIFLMYTDGVTEAMNKNGDLFSEARLLDICTKYRNCNMKELLESIKAEIDLFALNAEQADDITMLAFKTFSTKNA